MPKTIIHKIDDLEVTEYAETALFMRSGLIDGEIDGKKFALDANINGGCLILSIRSGKNQKQYTVNSGDIVKAIYGQITKAGE
jgi:hypothetical protein